MYACSQEKSFVQGWERPVRRPLPSHPPTTCTMHIAHCTLHIAQCTMHITHCTLHNAQCTMDHPQHTGERETYCSEILQQVIIEHHTCEHVSSRFAHQCKNYSIPVQLLQEDLLQNNINAALEIDQNRGSEMLSDPLQATPLIPGPTFDTKSSSSLALRL